MLGDENTLKVTDTHGRVSVIVYETIYSGVIMHITPLNLPTIRAIQVRAIEVLKYPDPRPFQEPEENSFDPNQLTDPENNPEYVRQCRDVDNARRIWADLRMFDMAVKFPAYPTRKDLINAFQYRLAELRAVAALPDDDFEAIIFHIILTWNRVGLNPQNQYEALETEFARVIQLAIQTVALTFSEVSAGMKFFRPDVQIQAARGLGRKPSSVQ